MGTTKINQNQYLPINSLSYNCLIDPNFTVNQRNYVSNATLAAGVYGHDRWKAGASGGDYTFTQLPQSTQITIKSGKSLIQVIEDKNVIGGTYTLSWTGTAQARFGINSATPSGAYAASPITITGQTAGTVMSVEFNEGTLGKVNCANSSVALPFMPKSYDEELRDCMRYCQDVLGGSTEQNISYGVAFCRSTTAAQAIINLPVAMRAIPTLGTITASQLSLGYSNVPNVALNSIELNATGCGKKCVLFDLGADSGLTANLPAVLYSNNNPSPPMLLLAEL
jgi:hypothetical protein